MRLWIPGVAFAAVGLAVAVSAQSERAESPRKYHSVEAEVVSADVDAMTITVKVAGEEHTEKVSALAKTRLSAVKAGEKVELSCKDVAGEHREVVSIRKPRAGAGK